MTGITLENLVLLRLNDVHNALLTENYPLALNALKIVWSLIPDKEIKKKIEEAQQQYQKAWQDRVSELKKLFNEREYDRTTQNMRMQQEEYQYMVDMVSGMANFTTQILIENNLIAREPSAP